MRELEGKLRQANSALMVVEGALGVVEGQRCCDKGICPKLPVCEDAENLTRMTQVTGNDSPAPSSRADEDRQAAPVTDELGGEGQESC